MKNNNVNKKINMESYLFEKKYLYKHNTEKIPTKTNFQNKLIIIRKKEKTNNFLHKSYIPQIEKITNKEKIEDENSILYKSAMIINNDNYNKYSIIKENINLSDIINKPKSTIKYNTALNTTIVKPPIIEHSVLKPIIMPSNISSSVNFENQDFLQQLMDSDFNRTKKEKQKDNIIQNFEYNKENKENIIPNNNTKNIRKKVIIQKFIKHKDNIIKSNQPKSILLNQPLPKEQNTLIIRKISDINNINDIKRKNRKEKINKSFNYRTDNNHETNKFNLNNMNSNDNNLRKSMKPIEKIKNITVNNTLKQKYEELIKDKKIVVRLKDYFENKEDKGPRDSIRYKNK